MANPPAAPARAPTSPRVMLVHAVREAIDPIHAAFAAHWPEARALDLLDTSLSADHAEDAGVLSDKMRRRFLALGDYAASSGPLARTTDAILFTCSAFGPAIEAVQHELRIPVAKPNEAAFAEALAAGSRIGLLVTFEPSLPPLSAELLAMAAARGQTIDIVPCVVPTAMAALRDGDSKRHDALVADAAGALRDVDILVLGQFSTARAADAVAQATGRRPITTPESAVRQLRDTLAASLR